MHILVTGGAGYIGSFMTKRLLQDNHTVTVLDSLERGHKNALDTGIQLLEGNILDKAFLSKVFSQTHFDAVIHFAGYISMAESMRDPKLYFENNTFATLQLLEAMRTGGVNRIIFSSTAGVYGNPNHIPIPEDALKEPTNPYGESKYMVERFLEWYSQIYGINSVSLRYFNAAGGALDGSMGEDHNPESHIIPLAIKAVLQKTPFTLYGTDYNTKDGTCVRDYIHVLDLVDAHVKALGKIENEKGAFVYNVGTGKGYSNREVVEMVKKISGINFVVQEATRRPGDAAELVADPSRIQKELGFQPQFSDLETIVRSAWKWHTAHA